MQTHDDGSGIMRTLGYLPPKHRLFLSSPEIDAEPLIPQSEWTPFDFPFEDKLPIKDQGSIKACQGFSDAEATEAMRFMANQDYVALSGLWAYGMITGGYDVGSSLVDGRALLLSSGIAPESECPPGIFNPAYFSAKSRVRAMDFKTSRSVSVTSESQLVTHLLRRHACVIAIPVGPYFSYLDREGVAPLEPQYYRNHAVSLLPALKRLSDGEWAIRITNHWSAAWGDRGRAWIRLRGLFDTRYFIGYPPDECECFAEYSVVEDPSNSWTKPRVS